MKKNKARTTNHQEDDFLPDISQTVSATECTGLIPTPVHSQAEEESYEALYSVEQPDGSYKPDGKKGSTTSRNASKSL